MHVRPHHVLPLLVCLLAPACGSEAEPGSKSERTRRALEVLFTAVRAEDRPAAAAGIAYRGDDASRAFKSAYDPTKQDEALNLKQAMDEIRDKLGDGAPTFVAFRSKRESEGEWLAWQVKTGKGTYWFACLEVDGRILLGDID